MRMWDFMPALDYCKSFLSSGQHIPNVLGGNWWNLIFLGLLVSTLLMVIVYMLSKSLRIPRLEGWARHEFFQILATAAIALLFIMLIELMCSFDASFLYGGISKAPQSCVQGSAWGKEIVTPYCAAQAYLSKLKARGEVLFGSLVWINGMMMYLFRITWESRPLGIGYTLEPLAGLQQIQNVFLIAISGFLVSYLSVLVQMRIIDFLVAAVPYYFMPLGLLLRCFSPTREFGGALIGFSIASLLFFPLILVLNDLIIYTTLDTITAPAEKIAQEMQSSEQFIGTISGGGLDAIAAGSKLEIQGKMVEIKNAIQVQDNEVIFQGLDGYSYRAEKSPSGIVSIWRSLNPINLEQGGATLNLHWGISQDQPQDNGTWKSKAFSAEGGMRYFTDPDPSAPNMPIGIRSEKLATSIIWPTQVVMVFSIAAVLLPIINFIIYIQIAKELTKFIGAEMDITNLTRMI
jgi:hypothetical protein